jgi:histidinol-phosphate/aromatic aminotransferase/cobyric acid decarboxylase-like protein
MPKTTTLAQPACEMCTTDTCKGVCDTIYADNNAVGRSITRYVPALYHLERAAPGDFSEYCNPNADRGPVASELRSALARREGVERHQLVIDGPGLGRMQTLPGLFGATDVVVATQDFPGFRKAAAASGVPLHEIGYGEQGDTIDVKQAVELVRGLERPMTMVTAPITNHGQARVSLAFVQAVATANPNGMVIIDPAYAASVPDFDRHDAVELALTSDNILYMNVAAKDLGACGTRVSWYIANKVVLEKLAADIDPYPVSLAAARYVRRLADRPAIVDAIHDVQHASIEIFRNGLAFSNLETRIGPGPWALVNLGHDAKTVVDILQAQFDIRVQLQTGNELGLDGWVRLSATVPCEARAVMMGLQFAIAQVRS